MKRPLRSASLLVVCALIFSVPGATAAAMEGVEVVFLQPAEPSAESPVHERRPRARIDATATAAALQPPHLMEPPTVNQMEWGEPWPPFARSGPNRFTPVGPPVSQAAFGESSLPAGAPTWEVIDAPPPVAPLAGQAAFGERSLPVAGFDPSVLAAVAQSRPEELEELYKRVIDLEPDRQNRQLIERVRQVVEETEVGVDTTDEKWVHVKGTSLTWGGRIQGDWVHWVNDSQFGGQSNYVEFRRLRLFAAGEGYGIYDYQLDLAFVPEFDLQGALEADRAALAGAGVELKDAFIGMRDVPGLGYVRIGHIRTPFNLESLTSSNFLTFMERGLPFRLAPGRELGVAAYNRTFDENLTWALGAFIDELPDAEAAIESDSQGARAIGRVTWTPWYDVPSEGRYLLHTGLGYAYTRPRTQDDPRDPGTLIRGVRFNARPEIHRGDQLIDTGILDAKFYHALNAELALVRGPLSLQSELVWTGIEEADGARTDLYGAYAYVSWFLTGENRRYNRRWADFSRVTPLENFWMVRTPAGVRRGWGAWELAARWSYLEFPDHGRQQLQDLTVGLNWHWNPQTRLMVNWIHPWARNSPESDLVRAEGDVLAMRLQVDF